MMKQFERWWTYFGNTKAQTFVPRYSHLLAYYAGYRAARRREGHL